MQWYLLKTWAGREEELVKEIRRTVPAYLYENVFVIHTERIWRRQGRSIIHQEPLFRGCAFLTCRDSEPIWRRMERVPFLSKWMDLGYLTVYPLMEKDAAFLQEIAGDGHVMRLSYVLRERGGMGSEALAVAGGGARYHISGPLEYCLADIETIEFRKRFVKLRKRLWGEDMVIAMGMILNEDLEQKLIYEGLEVTVELPQSWTELEVRKGADGKHAYIPGERSPLTNGTLRPVDGEIRPEDRTRYPADGMITVLPGSYGEIARVG